MTSLLFVISQSLGSLSVTLSERLSHKFYMIPVCRKVVIIFVKITFIHLPDVGIVCIIEPFANDICHMTRCTGDLKCSTDFHPVSKFVPVFTRSTIINNKL